MSTIPLSQNKLQLLELGSRLGLSIPPDASVSEIRTILLKYYKRICERRPTDNPRETSWRKRRLSAESRRAESSQRLPLTRRREPNFEESRVLHRRNSTIQRGRKQSESKKSFKRIKKGGRFYFGTPNRLSSLTGIPRGTIRALPDGADVDSDTEESASAGKRSRSPPPRERSRPRAYERKEESVDIETELNESTHEES